MSDTTSLVHPTYRHLERAPRLAGLTLPQWTGLVAAALVGYALTKVLPFSATYDLSVAATLAGVPVAVAIATGGTRTSPLAYLRAVLRWRRRAGVYVPGEPREAPKGYRLRATARPIDRQPSPPLAAGGPRNMIDGA